MTHSVTPNSAAAEPGSPGCQQGGSVAEPDKHPGYVLLRNGECCEDRIYLDVGTTAEIAAWWQHNNAPDGDVITVGAVVDLGIPVAELRERFPVCHWDAYPGLGRGEWTDPGPP